ncbi:MAG TPA: hypothetical protein VKF42_10210, partial [Chitinivibrionales bacterium]|nr:hypothetical protein [Chitinivibrionales bacterium]
LYIGGPHSIAGSIVGAGIFTLVPEGLRLVNLEAWRMAIYPLILILVMRFLRDGIMGDREFSFLVPWKYKEMVSKRSSPQEKDLPQSHKERKKETKESDN